ncbi:MAG: polyprenyl synthetase family protein [Chloroflexota bacterium]
MPKNYLIGEKLSQLPFTMPIQPSIQEVEELMRLQAHGRHPELQAAFDHLIVAGGKRIRPALVLLIGNMLGADHDRLITTAAAVEMLHTATLVHDDLIDGALLRRGNPTLNSHWSPAATVLTGDYIFARAAKLAANTDCLPLMKLFAETLAIIVNGELTQLFSSEGNASRENYDQRIYAKTASLFEMSGRAAAMISPVEQVIVEKMQEFGRNIGMAFQILDDILDFTGEQEFVGKPVGSDLLQGLVTLPTLYYIERYPDDKNIAALLNGDFSTQPDAIVELVQSIRVSECIKLAHNDARSLVEGAINNLKDMPVGEERQALEELAWYIVDRNL